MAGLFRKVNQDTGGLENRGGLPAWPVMIDDGRYLNIWADGLRVGRELFPLSIEIWCLV